MFAARRKFVAPSVLGAFEPATRGKLPLGLRRQVFPGPLRIGFRVTIRDMHDRVMVETANELRGPWACANWHQI